MERTKLKQGQMRAWRLFAAHALGALLLEDYEIGVTIEKAGVVADAMMAELEARRPVPIIDDNIACFGCGHRYDEHDPGGGVCGATRFGASGGSSCCPCVKFQSKRQA